MKSKITFLLFIVCLITSPNILAANFNNSDSTFNNYTNKLLLIKKIPIGTDYKKIKELFPNLSEMKKVGLRGNLYEAKVKNYIFNQKCIIKFNFKSVDTLDALYSFYYFIDSLNKNTADSIYLLLKKFYNKNYGNSSEYKEVDPAGFYNITSVWKTKKFSVVLTNNVYYNYNILSWGFQKPKIKK